MNTIHRALLKITRGHLGWELAHMPVLELTTTGRNTGQTHSVMLTSPLLEGSTIVVVASSGGADQHPSWFLNLRAEPDVEIALNGQPKQRARARIARPEERARLWPQITAHHKNYAHYQTKTTREIPLVLLKPVDETPSVGPAVSFSQPPQGILGVRGTSDRRVPLWNAEAHAMAIGQILQFSGAGIDKYDAVRQELGWDGEKGKPEGILAHAAGSTGDGFCVVEWWSSEGAWDKFFAERLKPAFEKVGDVPQPQMTRFEVHASYVGS